MYSKSFMKLFQIWVRGTKRCRSDGRSCAGAARRSPRGMRRVPRRPLRLRPWRRRMRRSRRVASRCRGACRRPTTRTRCRRRRRALRAAPSYPPCAPSCSTGCAKSAVCRCTNPPSTCRRRLSHPRRRSPDGAGVPWNARSAAPPTAARPARRPGQGNPQTEVSFLIFKINKNRT
jgi:hypothetical protein